MPERGLVFHLASIVGVRHVLARPSDVWSTAVEGTENLCRLALERGARLVFTSSSEVYGDGRGTALAEDALLPEAYGPWPRASYPESKRTAEAIVLDFCQKGGDGRIARLFNVSGPGQSPSGGMVLPTFVSQALAGRPMTVVGNGADVRCFQHVSDTVRGLTKLGALARGRGTILNLGGYEPVRMQELAERVRSLVDPAARITRITSAERYGATTAHCRHRVPALGNARALLAHEPVRTLDEIICDVAQAMRAEPARESTCVESRVTLAS